jgi:hypothetical protein
MIWELALFPSSIALPQIDADADGSKPRFQQTPKNGSSLILKGQQSR